MTFLSLNPTVFSEHASEQLMYNFAVPVRLPTAGEGAPDEAPIQLVISVSFNFFSCVKG